MDDLVKEAAVEWIQQNLSEHIVTLSDDGIKYLLQKHYPTRWVGFRDDITAGFKP